MLVAEGEGCCSRCARRREHGAQERDDASDIRQRIRADYREMPGLRVTVPQGARLWNVPPALCERLLDDLVREQELVRSGEHYRLP